MRGDRISRKVLLAIALVLAAGCERHGKPLELLGETIAPPAPFDTLKVGMTVAEAKAKLPELTGELQDTGFAELVVKDVPVKVVFEHSRLSEITLRLERPSFEAELVKRWGPSRTTAPGIVEWNGPLWHANHSCTKDGSACSVEFERPLRPLTAAFFGTRVAPPGDLAKLRLEMSLAEAKTIVPSLVGPFATTDTDLGVDDVEAAIVVTETSGVLAITIRLKTDAALTMLRNAWGNELEMTDQHHAHGRDCWQGEAWRACIDVVTGSWRTIQFEQRITLASVLGEGEQVAYAAGVLGATRAQLETKFGALHAPVHCGGCPRLIMPSSELGAMYMDFHIESDKVVRFDLLISYGGEKQRAAVFDMLLAKWGAKAKLPSDVADEKAIVLRAKAPHVALTDVHHDPIGGFMWRVEVTP